MHNENENEKIINLMKKSDVGYEGLRSILLESTKIEKENKILKDFVNKLIEKILEEGQKDGICTLKVSIELIQEIQKLIAEVN